MHYARNCYDAHHFCVCLEFTWSNCMTCLDCVLNKVNYEMIKPNIAGDEISSLKRLMMNCRKRYFFTIMKFMILDRFELLCKIMPLYIFY